jgi:hypothetical protein
VSQKGTQVQQEEALKVAVGPNLLGRQRRRPEAFPVIVAGAVAQALQR